ncbi:MAG: class E sortase [Actinomycetota bacterium]|nr:class E sortase [Actinomycetota bacterium]
MRRRLTSTAVALGVVMALTAGCGGQAESRNSTVPRKPDPRILLWSLKPPKPPVLPTLPTTVPLPHPVGIPDDPYAPEPVKQIGTMQIPKIGLDHPIFEGVTLHNIDKGPSHWPGTAVPGHRGNAVFAAHRVTNDHPFRRIAELVAGDQVIFTIDGSRTTYVVTGNLVVTPADTWIAQQTPAVTATLYACHPPGSVEQRYVVRMQLAA